MVGFGDSHPARGIFSQIEGAAKIGQHDPNQLQVAVLRLVDPAKSFYNARLELDMAEIQSSAQGKI